MIFERGMNFADTESNNASSIRDNEPLKISSCSWSPSRAQIAFATQCGKVAVVHLPHLVDRENQVLEHFFLADGWRNSVTIVHSLPAIALPSCLNVQWSASGLELMVWDEQPSRDILIVISF